MNKPSINYLESHDFGDISFHDNHVYGFSVRRKEFGEDLILDIDYISEWICHDDKTCSFKIVPSNLTFIDIVDLEISLSWGKSLSQPDPKYSVSHLPSGEIILNGITEEKYDDPIYSEGEREFLKYTFDFIIPENGVLSLGATQVSLIGRQLPVESDEQYLDWSMRE